MMSSELLSLHEQLLAPFFADEDDRHLLRRLINVEQHAELTVESQFAPGDGVRPQCFSSGASRPVGLGKSPKGLLEKLVTVFFPNQRRSLSTDSFSSTLHAMRRILGQTRIVVNLLVWRPRNPSIPLKPLPRSGTRVTDPIWPPGESWLLTERGVLAPAQFP